MSRTPCRTALAALLAAGVLSGLGVLAPAAGADAGTAPKARLLAVEHLPTAKPFSSWKATPAALMDTQWLCEEEALPVGKTRWRTFYNSKAGTALTQYAVRMPSAAAAKKAAARVRSCFSRASLAERLLPEELADVSPRTLLRSALKDGLRVGVLTTRLTGPDEHHLWSVGRDGRYLSVLVLPLLSESGAPTAQWSAISRKALRRVAR
ncbi:MAG: hypothetical protein ACT4PP_05685 [Sporichthyaceae bacterium]